MVECVEQRPGITCSLTDELYHSILHTSCLLATFKAHRCAYWEGGSNLYTMYQQQSRFHNSCRIFPIPNIVDHYFKSMHKMVGWCCGRLMRVESARHSKIIRIMCHRNVVCARIRRLFFSLFATSQFPLYNILMVSAFVNSTCFRGT